MKTTRSSSLLRTILAGSAFAACAALFAPDAWAQQNAGQPIAYVWADQPKAAQAYTPSAGYSFNAKKGANQITRTGAGTYQVKLGNAKTSGGHAQVSAYGAGSDHCKIVSWNPAGADEVINVACFNAAGAPTDAQFALIFFN